MCCPSAHSLSCQILHSLERPCLTSLPALSPRHLHLAGFLVTVSLFPNGHGRRDLISLLTADPKLLLGIQGGGVLDERMNE